MTKEEMKKEILDNKDLTDAQKVKMIKAIEEDSAASTNEGYGNNSDDILLG